MFFFQTPSTKETYGSDEKADQPSSGKQEMVVMWNEDLTRVEVKAAPIGERRLSRNDKIKSRAMPYTMKIQFKSTHEKVIEEAEEESLRRSSSRKMSHVDKIKNRKMPHAKATSSGEM